MRSDRDRRQFGIRSKLTLQGSGVFFMRMRYSRAVHTQIGTSTTHRQSGARHPGCLSSRLDPTDTSLHNNKTSVTSRDRLGQERSRQVNHIAREITASLKASSLATANPSHFDRDREIDHDENEGTDQCLSRGGWIGTMSAFRPIAKTPEIQNALP